MLMKTVAIAELQENELKSFKAKITIAVMPSIKIFETSDVFTSLCNFSEATISTKTINKSKIIGMYPTGILFASKIFAMNQFYHLESSQK